MRFESVTADAFGPFSGEKLTFAPTMNVIYGLNEAGKSSWHECLYAALCGMRRGQGQTREDKEFARLRRPWEGQEWCARAVIVLADGRRIELRQDLKGRIDCAAIDLTTAVDVSAEIINEGTPDGSKWLGLDRNSFVATACIRQTDLLGVLAHPDALQEGLQRAAATARADATAAAAIERLKAFRSDAVGLERRTSTKPLQAAIDELRPATASLEQARERHAKYQELAAQAEKAKTDAAKAEQALRLVEAARSRAEADRLALSLQRAEELSKRFPDGSPPDIVLDEELANRVAAAISAWDARPAEIDLTGTLSRALREQLRALPDAPQGDTRMHETVLQAKQRLDTARQRLLLLGDRPAEPTIPNTGGASAETLIRLATALEAEDLELDPILVGDRERAARRVARRPGWYVPALVAGGAGLIAGGAILAAGAFTVGLVLLVAGAGALLAAVLAANRARIRALEALRAAEAALGQSQHDVAAIQKARELALGKVKEMGLTADPDALRATVAKVNAAEVARNALNDWLEKRTNADRELIDALVEVRVALRDRGFQDVDDADDLEAALATYEEQCRERSRAAALAKTRPGIEQRLRDREELERAAENSRQDREDAERDLRAVAAEASIQGRTPEELYEGLTSWAVARAETLQARQTAVKEWTSLSEILGDGTLEELRASVSAARQRAVTLAEGLDPNALDEVSHEPDVDAQIAKLRGELRNHTDRVSGLTGRLLELAKATPDVAAAEERYEAAEEELARVRDLDRILDVTLQHLQCAQERVYRDIAPVLQATVERWLSGATDGRYVEALVNPETLKVSVRGPGGLAWRPADQLSQGTRELIYLLLRVALAEHLVRPGEVTPMILDDVTVQCDTPRTGRLLDVLHEISGQRQVILFSQEDDVLAWARDALEPECIRVLDPLVEVR